MKAADIAMSLNLDFRCPNCKTRANWRSAGRAAVRANSTLYRFRCKRCGERVVVKLAPLDTCDARGRHGLEKEFQTLRKLQEIFPTDGAQGALAAESFLQINDHAAMVTRLFRGKDLVRYARSADPEELGRMFHSAGALLRSLHDGCPDGYQVRELDVGPKLAYLEETYGRILLRNSKARKAFAHLRASADVVGLPPLRVSWAHGDYKPENVLYDGRRTILLDTKLDIRGPVVYDLASFLNHVRIAACSFRSGALRNNNQLIEAAFLSGYGALDAGETAALRWAQLYFMLCYFGAYRKRGFPSSIYANWRLAPLGELLAMQVA
jgi:Ser/Thr protein kinase RdoA (MazF antagonist)